MDVLSSYPSLIFSFCFFTEHISGNNDCPSPWQDEKWIPGLCDGILVSIGHGPTRDTLPSNGCLSVEAVIHFDDGTPSPIDADQVKLRMKPLDVVLWCPAIQMLVDVMSLGKYQQTVAPFPSSSSSTRKFPALDFEVGRIRVYCPKNMNRSDAPTTAPGTTGSMTISSIQSTEPLTSSPVHLLLLQIASTTIEPNVDTLVASESTNVFAQADTDTASHGSFMSSDLPLDIRFVLRLTGISVLETVWTNSVSSSSNINVSGVQDNENPAFRWNASLNVVDEVVTVPIVQPFSMYFSVSPKSAYGAKTTVDHGFNAGSDFSSGLGSGPGGYASGTYSKAGNYYAGDSGDGRLAEGLVGDAMSASVSSHISGLDMTISVSNHLCILFSIDQALLLQDIIATNFIFLGQSSTNAASSIHTSSTYVNDVMEHSNSFSLDVALLLPRASCFLYENRSESEHILPFAEIVLESLDFSACAKLGASSTELHLSCGKSSVKFASAFAREKSNIILENVEQLVTAECFDHIVLSTDNRSIVPAILDLKIVLTSTIILELSFQQKVTIATNVPEILRAMTFFAALASVEGNEVMGGICQNSNAELRVESEGIPIGDRFRYEASSKFNGLNVGASSSALPKSSPPPDSLPRRNGQPCMPCATYPLVIKADEIQVILESEESSTVAAHGAARLLLSKAVFSQQNDESKTILSIAAEGASLDLLVQQSVLIPLALLSALETTILFSGPTDPFSCPTKVDIATGFLKACFSPAHLHDIAAFITSCGPLFALSDGSSVQSTSADKPSFADGVDTLLVPYPISSTPPPEINVHLASSQVDTSIPTHIVGSPPSVPISPLLNKNLIVGPTTVLAYNSTEVDNDLLTSSSSTHSSMPSIPFPYSSQPLTTLITASHSSSSRNGDTMQSRSEKSSKVSNLESVDDLRRGQFSFVVSSERPVVHQIVFSPDSSAENCMIWKYGHVRHITSLRVTPVPFDVELAQTEGTEDLQIPCVLQYFDDIKQQFLPVYQFSLFQSKASQYTIHSNIAAEEWRVRISKVENKSRFWSDNGKRFMEVDSEKRQLNYQSIIYQLSLNATIGVYHALGEERLCFLSFSGSLLMCQLQLSG